jgi:hypothetical protein
MNEKSEKILEITFFLNIIFFEKTPEIVNN